MDQWRSQVCVWWSEWCVAETGGWQWSGALLEWWSHRTRLRGGGAVGELEELREFSGDGGLGWRREKRGLRDRGPDVRDAASRTPPLQRRRPAGGRGRVREGPDGGRDGTQVQGKSGSGGSSSSSVSLSAAQLHFDLFSSAQLSPNSAPQLDGKAWEAVRVDCRSQRRLLTARPRWTTQVSSSASPGSAPCRRCRCCCPCPCSLCPFA